MSVMACDRIGCENVMCVGEFVDELKEQFPGMIGEHVDATQNQHSLLTFTTSLRYRDSLNTEK